MKLSQNQTIKTTDLLGLLSGVSISLLLFRIMITSNWNGIFLIWNLFLAWIPLWVILLVRDYVISSKIQKAGLIVGIGAWLVFFPNAPYLITDLMHLRESPQNLIWFDALMGFSFAMSGLFVGLYSVLWVHRLTERVWNKGVSYITIPFYMLLSGYGIYLGRFGRWNSWNILNHPFSLLKYIKNSLHNPLAIQTTLAFSFVLLITYAVFFLLSQKYKSESKT